MSISRLGALKHRYVCANGHTVLLESEPVDPHSVLKRCSSCKCAYYCSAECQAEHWARQHKGECEAIGRELARYPRIVRSNAEIRSKPVPDFPSPSWEREYDRRRPLTSQVLLHGDTNTAFMRFRDGVTLMFTVIERQGDDGPWVASLPVVTRLGWLHKIPAWIGCASDPFYDETLDARFRERYCLPITPAVPSFGFGRATECEGCEDCADEKKKGAPFISVPQLQHIVEEVYDRWKSVPDSIDPGWDLDPFLRNDAAEFSMPDTFHEQKASLDRLEKLKRDMDERDSLRNARISEALRVLYPPDGDDAAVSVGDNPFTAFILRTIDRNPEFGRGVESMLGRLSQMAREIVSARSARDSVAAEECARFDRLPWRFWNKRLDVPGSDKWEPCILCLDMAVRTRTVPCGHQTSCLGCANKFLDVYPPHDPDDKTEHDKRICVVCRAPIEGLVIVEPIFLGGEGRWMTKRRHDDDDEGDRPTTA